MSFYQSKIWETINKEIYQKPTFDFCLFDRNYFWVIKKIKKGFIELNWYQILGVELPESWESSLEQATYIKEEINKLKRDFAKNYWDIYFQIGFTNIIDQRYTNNTKNQETINEIKNLRLQKQEYMKNTFWLIPSPKENMPVATNYVDLSQSLDQIRSDISKNTKEKIKKWNKKLKFEEANWKDIKNFYELWFDILSEKWIYIIPEQQYFDLINYLNKEKLGKLFVVKDENDKIAAGSIFAFYKDTVIYLYGATHKNFGNIWADQKLKFDTIKYAKEKEFKYFDFRGSSPVGFPNHHLQNVTNFKKGFNGIWEEYLWNYDLVFNKNLYTVYKYLRTN